MFDYCCETPNLIKYNLLHNEKPIILSQEMLEALERLLWYVPEISSYQCSKNELIKESIYDDFCFNYILTTIGMNEKDVKILPRNTDIESESATYFDKICINCQKVILTKNASETKSLCLLRHIRNCIAHGRFNVCHDTLIGFDYANNKHTAIIKIKPKTLLNALKLLESGITYQHLFAYAFKNLGYAVTEEPWFNRYVDLFIEKDNKKYLIEIKKHKSGYLKEDAVEKVILQYENTLNQMSEDTQYVLIIDKVRLTKASKELLSNQQIQIMDINEIKKLLDNNDVLNNL